MVWIVLALTDGSNKAEMQYATILLELEVSQQMLFFTTHGHLNNVNILLILMFYDLHCVVAPNILQNVNTC